VYLQIAQQVVQLKAEDLRLPSRAWKVKLVGEGADDAGGVFDDTITEMCLVSLAFSCYTTYKKLRVTPIFVVHFQISLNALKKECCLLLYELF
jgi:hypothetical protein